MKVASDDTPTETPRTTHREHLWERKRELQGEIHERKEVLDEVDDEIACLMAEETCGCRIVSATGNPRVIHCTKHAAVDELLASFDELYAQFFPGGTATNVTHLDFLKNALGPGSGAAIARMLTAMRRARPEGGHDDSDAPKTPTAEELLQELLAVFKIFTPSRMVLLANSAGCRDGAKVSSADADDLRKMAAAAQAIIDKVAGEDGGV